MPDEAQQHRSDSGLSDSLDVKVVPIVFVPGVMGSRLKLNGPRWDPDDLVQFLQFPAMFQEDVAKILNAENKASGGSIDFDLSTAAVAAIKADSFAPTVPARAGTPLVADPDDPDKPLRRFFEQRGWGSVVFSFYGPLLLALEQTLNAKKGGIPYPVYAVGYDWRQSNQDSGRELLKSIKSILLEHKPAEKVIIVSHSMGGLVSLSALHDGAASNVAGAVHCLMPSTGAAVAYRRFQTGADLPFDGPPGGSSTKDWIAAVALNSVMGTNRDEYTLTQSGLRGPLQLLPSKNYPNRFLNTLFEGVVRDNTDPAIGDIYELYLLDDPPGIVPKPPFIFVPFTTNFKQSDIDRLKKNIRLARDFHNRISQIPTAYTDTFLIIGDAVQTDVEFDWMKGQVMQRDDCLLKTIKQPLGDGTVPAVSAKFPFANPSPQNRDFTVNPPSINADSIFNGAQHAACFSVPALVAKVVKSVQLLIPNA